MPAGQVNASSLSAQQALLAAEQETARRLAAAQAQTKVVQAALQKQYPYGMSDAQWQAYLQKDPQGQKFNQDWLAVQRSAANQLRLAGDGAKDPSGAGAAIDSEAAKLKASGKGDATLKLLVDDAVKSVKGQSAASRATSERAFRMEIVNQTPGATDAQKSTALNDFNQALGHEIALQAAQLHLKNAQADMAALNKEPGGARRADYGDVSSELSRAQSEYAQVQAGHDDAGVDVSPAEQQQAAQAVAQGHSTELYSLGDKSDPLSVPGETAVISAQQMLQHYVANVNPNDPTLTPAQKQLAQSDPVAFAQVQMSGVQIDPSQIKNGWEKQLAQSNPLEYAIYKMTGVDATGVNPDDPSLSATDKTELHNKDYLQYAIAHASQSAQAKIGLLLGSGQTVRFNRVQSQVNQLTQGTRTSANDAKALQILQTNMSQALLPGEADALWTQIGAPKFSASYLQSQFNALMKSPGREPSNDPSVIQAQHDDTMNADKVGKWLQQMTKNAPPQFAALALDTIQKNFNEHWFESNTGTPAMGRGTDFYKGLSQAVQVADAQDPQAHQYADSTAQWLLAASNLKGGETGKAGPMIFIIQGGGDGGMTFQSVRDAMSGGYGTDLADALNRQIGTAKSGPPPGNFTMAYQLGSQEAAGKQNSQYAQQSYQSFLQTAPATLKAYFNDIGQHYGTGSSQFGDTTQLDNFIAAGLNMAPDAVAMPTAPGANGQGTQAQSPLMTAQWLRQAGYAAPQSGGKPISNEAWAQLIVSGQYALPLTSNGQLLSAQELAKALADNQYAGVKPPTDGHGHALSAAQIAKALSAGQYRIPSTGQVNFGAQATLDGRHAVPVDIYGKPLSEGELLHQISIGTYQGENLYAHNPKFADIVTPIAKQLQTVAGVSLPSQASAPGASGAPMLTVSLIPTFYASNDGGASPSGLFGVTDKSSHHTKLIDDRGWHYDNLSDYQHNNALSGGKLYVPTWLQTRNDAQPGGIELASYSKGPAGAMDIAYSQVDSHQTTGWQHVENVLSIGAELVTAAAGTALLFTGVGTALGVTLLGVTAAGVGWGMYTSVEDLHNMAEHGGTINPFADGRARMDWGMLAVSAFGLGASGATLRGARLLMLAKTLPEAEQAGVLADAMKWDTLASRINRPAMVGGTYQMVNQGESLIRNWDQMSGEQKWSQLAMIGMNLTPFFAGKYIKSLRGEIMQQQASNQRVLDAQAQAQTGAGQDGSGGLFQPGGSPDGNVLPTAGTMPAVNVANPSNTTRTTTAAGASGAGDPAQSVNAVQGGGTNGSANNGTGNQQGGTGSNAVPTLLYTGADVAALYDAVALGQLQEGQFVYLLQSAEPTSKLQRGVVLADGVVRGRRIEWRANDPSVTLGRDTHFVVTSQDLSIVYGSLGQGRAGIGPYALFQGQRGWIMPEAVAAAEANGTLSGYFAPRGNAPAVNWSSTWMPETLAAPPMTQALLYRGADVQALYEDAAAGRLAPGAQVTLVWKGAPTANLDAPVVLAEGRINDIGQLQWLTNNPNVTLGADTHFVVTRDPVSATTPVGPYALHAAGRWVPNEQLVLAEQQGALGGYFPTVSFEPDAQGVPWTPTWTPWAPDPAALPDTAPPEGQMRVYGGTQMAAVNDAAWNGELPAGTQVHVVTSRTPGPNFEQGALRVSGAVDPYGKIVWGEPHQSGGNAGGQGDPQSQSQSQSQPQQPLVMTLGPNEHIVVNDLAPQDVAARFASGQGLGPYAVYDGANGWIAHDVVSDPAWQAQRRAPAGPARTWRPVAPAGVARLYRGTDVQALYRDANTGALLTGEPTGEGASQDANTQYVYLVRHARPGLNLKGGEVLGWGQVNRNGGIAWSAEGSPVTLGADTHFVVTDVAPDAMPARLTQSGLRYSVYDENAGWLPHKSLANARRNGTLASIFPATLPDTGGEPTVWTPLDATMASGGVTTLPTMVRTGQAGTMVDEENFHPNPAGPRQLRGWERVADTVGGLFTRRAPSYDAQTYTKLYSELQGKMTSEAFAELGLPAPGSFAPDDMTRVLAAVPGGLEHVIADVHAHSMGYDRRSGNLFVALLDKSGKYERILFGSIPQFCGGDGHYSTVTPAPATMKNAAVLDDRVAGDFTRLYQQDPALAAKADLSITGVEFSPNSKQDPVAYVQSLLKRYPGLFKSIGEITANKEMITLQLGPDAWDVNSAAFHALLKFANESGIAIVLHNDWSVHGIDEAGRPAAVKQYYENFDKMIEVLSRPEYRNVNVVLAHTGISRFGRPNDEMISGYVKVVNPDGTSTRKLITAPEHIHKLYQLFANVPNARADISWNDVTQAYTDNPNLRSALVDFIVDNKDRLLFGSDTVKPVNTGQYNQALNTGSPLFAAIAARDPMALWQLLRGNYEALMADAETRTVAWTRAELTSEGRFKDIAAMDQMLATLQQHRSELQRGAWRAFNDWLAAFDRIQQSAAEGGTDSIVVPGTTVPAGGAAQPAGATNPGAFPVLYDSYGAPQDQNIVWHDQAVDSGNPTGLGTTGGRNNDSLPRQLTAGALAVSTATAAASAEAAGLSDPSVAGAIDSNAANAGAFDVRGLLIGVKTLYGEKMRLDWESIFEQGHVTRDSLNRFVGRLADLAPHLGITDAQIARTAALTEQFWENYKFLRDLPVDPTRGWTAEQKFHAIMAKVGEYQITVDRTIGTQASSINALDARAPAGKLYRAGVLGTYLFNDAATAAWAMGGNVDFSSPQAAVATAFHTIFGAANTAMTLHTIAAMSGGLAKVTWESSRLSKWVQGGAMTALGAGGLTWTALDLINTRGTGGPVSAALDSLFTLGTIWAARNEMNKSLARPMVGPGALAKPYYLLAGGLVARELIQLSGGAIALPAGQRRHRADSTSLLLQNLQAQNAAQSTDTGLRDDTYIAVPLDLPLGAGTTLRTSGPNGAVVTASSLVNDLGGPGQPEASFSYRVAPGDSLWKIVSENLPALLSPAQQLRASLMTSDEEATLALQQFYRLDPQFDPNLFAGEMIEFGASPSQA
ncbi:hypothetical protein PATSB16_30270 [Pandoraea thiooxydans]|nr:hypothetical protein PATSB16_30270 [Pandoraea thiooxydans]